jgi:dienelactone hydrolase
MVARVALAVTLLLTFAPPAGAAVRPFPRFHLRTCGRADFESEGTRVRAELCRATRNVRAGRAVVVLHGCGGFSTFDHRLAGDLPQKGIATLYVDFFGPTPPTGRRGFCGGPRPHRAFLRENLFGRWQRVVVDAARSLRHTPGIDPRRVGVLGWSLGGGLAVSTAAATESSHLFSAVVGFSTGSRPGPRTPIRLPPLLLLSGGTTDAVPVTSTRALYEAAKAAGDRAQLYVFPRGRHDWPGRQGRIGIARAVAFLDATMS